jgi:ABC-type Co2+ transport system permease subunit
MAGAAVVAQAVSGALWLVVVGLGLRSGAAGTARVGLFAGVAFPMWIIGILIESVVAFGVARFLARVRPDLLPGGTRPVEGER